MGLGTAFHLSERGYRVTLLEKQKDVAKVASYINGAMICPSMTASWASLSLLSKVICFCGTYTVHCVANVYAVLAFYNVKCLCWAGMREERKPLPLEFQYLIFMV